MCPVESGDAYFWQIVLTFEASYYKQAAGAISTYVMNMSMLMM